MKKFIYTIIFVFALISCEDESVTKSSEADILDFTLIDSEGIEVTETYLDKKYNKIVLFSDEILNSSYPISITPQIIVSPGATVSPIAETTSEFSKQNESLSYTVVAEDGTNRIWNACLMSKQLPNSDFEAWFDQQGANGKFFKEPGASLESTFWATANMGTSTFGVYGTKPIYEGENTLVEITTGETLVPITAGTIFAGKFDVQGAYANPTDPTKATDMGIPFIYRPSHVKFKYKYEPGETYVKATLKNPSSLLGGFNTETIDGNDSCYVYGSLDFRSGDDLKEIASFNFTSGETVSQLTEVIIPISYSSSDKPSHFSIVFTSSKEGDFYTGSVGSRLVIDDLELLYE